MFPFGYCHFQSTFSIGNEIFHINYSLMTKERTKAFWDSVATPLLWEGRGSYHWPADGDTVFFLEDQLQPQVQVVLMFYSFWLWNSSVYLVSSIQIQILLQGFSQPYIFLDCICSISKCHNYLDSGSFDFEHNFLMYLYNNELDKCLFLYHLSMINNFSKMREYFVNQFIWVPD